MARGGGHGRAVHTTIATDGTPGNGVDARHLGEVILEVMSWPPGFVEALTAASGGETRLADLDVTIAAALAAHAVNIGYTPLLSNQSVGREQSRLRPPATRSTSST